MNDTAKLAEPFEGLAESLDFLPEAAKRGLEEGIAWIHENPTKAAALSAAGGIALGILGVSRIYSAGKALRAMPIVSQLLLGVVVKGLASRGFGEDSSLH